MKGRQSAEYFHPCWNGDNHCGGCEVSSRVYVHPNGEHVVSSYDEAKEADGHHCSDHAHVAERFFFARVVCDDVRNHTKAGKDENVDFGVSEEPE